MVRSEPAFTPRCCTRVLQVARGRLVRWWILANRTSQLEATLQAVPRLDYRLIPLDQAWAQLRSRSPALQRQGRTAQQLHVQDLADLPAFEGLERLVVLGDAGPASLDVMPLWHQQPACSNTTLLTGCDRGRSAGTVAPMGASLTRPAGPVVVLLQNARAMRQSAARGADDDAGGTECFTEGGQQQQQQQQQQQPQRRQAEFAASGVVALDDALQELSMLLDAGISHLRSRFVPPSPPLLPLAPAAPVGETSTPQLVGPPHPSSRRAVGSRSLLTGAPALIAELQGDSEEERVGQITPLKRTDYSREQRLAALTVAARKREFSLPPPLATSVLPPALPPLPLPLNVLRQRMGAKGGPQAPSLPPPVPMGKQCAPEQHSTCGCAGGTCECDLYPDYSPHPAPSSPSRQSSTADDEDERTVVPPLRRLQFFNSNFKSRLPLPPSSSPSRHTSSKRGRSLKERRTGPSLRVLCYCRCPSRDDLFG